MRGREITREIFEFLDDAATRGGKAGDGGPKNLQLELVVAQQFSINPKIPCNSGGPLLERNMAGGVPPAEKTGQQSKRVPK
ncbi:MAG: hypothetical protein ABSA47_10950 [Verrucomicrobiota bacterium]